MTTEFLVSTDWLAEHLFEPTVRVVDIRGFVTTKTVADGVEHAVYRGAHEEYLAGHIKGASFIDWTSDITDPLDPVPAQIAPPDRFAEAMASRGIGDETTVIAVDHGGGQFATRLWWALSFMAMTLSPFWTAAGTAGSKKAGKSSPAKCHSRALNSRLGSDRVCG